MPHSPKPITEESLSVSAGTPPTAADYFDAQSGRFLIRNESGRWLPLDQANYKRHLRARGLRSKVEERQTLSEIDDAILDVQHHRDIAYSGAVCGQKTGLIQVNGQRILVTDEMRLPEPAPGPWQNLREIIEGLLAGSEDEGVGITQTATFHAWMRSSVLALRAGRQQQQQALALCGPPRCGKSLLQGLITEMLAGRGCKAERYFSGKTPFNADLYSAEHLILDDEHCSTRLDQRVKLGAALKQHTVSTYLTSLHAKGKTAINLPGWWRVSISLNDDPEAMMILPPLDDHIADKIILLRASRFTFPLPNTTTEERISSRDQYVAEIPAYLHWLIHEWNTPADVDDPDRYNVLTFHHPDLAEALECFSPEGELLDLLELAFTDRFAASLTVEMSHAEIEDAIRIREPRRADRLFSWRNACGSYLGKLAKKYPKRIQPRSDGSRRWWLIRPAQPCHTGREGVRV